ncbi:MAG: hypothetical protein RLZZ387_5559 [Chloroflexota bacterium]|jgi:hypothetical protein
MTTTTYDYAAWQVKNEAILHELTALVKLTDEERTLLAALAPDAQAAVATLSAAFYQRLERHANTAEYLLHDNMPRMHANLGTWFTEVFSGTYDSAYTRRRLVIGEIHVKIGLPVRYPLAMLDVIMTFGEAVARRSPNPTAAVTAFRKVLALDVAVFNQAYEDEQLRQIADLVGGERLARRLLSGEV